jgi:hypothetical protein
VGASGETTNGLRGDTVTDIDVGPIDFLAVEIPQGQMKGEGFTALLDLVEKGIIRVLDLRAVMVGEDGELTAMSIGDFDGDGTLDLAVFDGAASGLLDDDDVQEAAALVGKGNAVVVLLYENTWAGPFVSAMRRAGAELIASGRIPANDVVAALDALETAD